MDETKERTTVSDPTSQTWDRARDQEHRRKSQARNHVNQVRNQARHRPTDQVRDEAKDETRVSDLRNQSWDRTRDREQHQCKGLRETHQGNRSVHQDDLRTWENKSVCSERDLNLVVFSVGAGP